jgi:adenine-specific DNA-methyltransferase
MPAHSSQRGEPQRRSCTPAQLIVTSPPYNIGKKYEKRVQLSDYLRREEEVINLCIDRLRPGGSIC